MKGVVGTVIAIVGLWAAAPAHAAIAKTLPPSGLDAASLREGLWIFPNSECRFDAGEPVFRWPKCATWGVIQAGVWLQYAPNRWGGLWIAPPAEGDVWARAPFALPPGDRRILQLKTDPFGESGYQFLELRPERRDAAQRITAFTMGFPAPDRPFAWTPPTRSASGFDPFPDAEATLCVSDPGRCETGEPYFGFTLTWVRDPRPDDFARR
jgi:hypothetical protein